MANTTGLGDTIYAAVKKALEDKNGGSGGSGGSSDLSIAQVTFRYTHEETGGNTGFALPIMREAMPGPMGDLPAYAASAIVDNSFDGETISVILYKGLCIAHYDGTGTLTASGNATYSNHHLEITGDCNIAIEDETH